MKAKEVKLPTLWEYLDPFLVGEPILGFVPIAVLVLALLGIPAIIIRIIALRESKRAQADMLEQPTDNLKKA